MILNNIKTKQKEHGFTIVELLVVIVVIGILAAITIVSYAGITNRAYGSTAQTTANAVTDKANAYSAQDNSNYFPKTYATLSADSTQVYYLPANTATLVTTAISAAPAVASANSINYQVCGATDVAGTAPTTAALTTKPLGIKVTYWNYGASPAAAVTVNVGNVTTGAGAVTIGGTAYTTACNYALT